ncbi:separin-like [Lytechinus pictus]|uniref:separin-like n=1 Tax=Lytechinus pictus TaxID=7653 RepID=UPI0030B9BE86
MDGAKLLKSLKDGPMDTLVSDVKIYLDPLHKNKCKTSDDLTKKRGVFAMKILRGCVESITSLSLGSQHLSSVLNVARACYEGICAARSHMEIIPLSLEKVLFHIVLQLVNKTLLMDALSFAEYLYSELITSRPLFETVDGMDNEYDTIAKQAFNQLWKACAQIEKSTKTCSRHILVLNARRQALAFVMLTDQDTAWIANAALRAGVEMERYSSKDTSSSEHLCHFFAEIANGLLTPLERKLKSQQLTDVAKALGPVLDVCLQQSKYCARSEKSESVIRILMRIQACTECKKQQSLTIASARVVCAICDVMRISLSLAKLNTGSKDKSKCMKSKESKIGSGDVWNELKHSSDVIAKSIETSDVVSAFYQPLVDSFAFLRKQVEVVINKEKSHPASDLHSSVYQALSVSLEILEIYKEYILSSSQSPTDVYRGLSVSAFTTRLVNKQLSTLNFMATLTIQELNNLSSGTQGENVKQQFGSRAITICKRTKAVMEDVSKGEGGVISVNEYRCLGSNAYNLGFLCYKQAWYGFASSLVRLSCEQLQRWCSTELGPDEQKVQEIQLARKYELLVDCQRRAGLHRDAMTTAALSLLVIPGLKFDDVRSRAEQWVKAKREALKINDDPDLRNRTLLDACEEMEEELAPEQLSVVSVALREEFNVYRAQRHDTSVEQYAAIQDLIRMYSNEGHEMEKASVLIQLTQLLYSSGVESESSPRDICIQTIDLLEGLNQENLGVHSDLMAQAKFWLYLCQLESSIQNSNNSCSSPNDVEMDSSQESSIDTSKDEETPPPCTLIQESSQIAPLISSLEIWGSLLQEEPFDSSCFQDPQSTMQCLQLAADIMAASGKTVEEIWVLSMLSKLAISTSSSLESLEADLHLSRLLARVGLYEQATITIDRAEKLLHDLSDAKRSTLVTKFLLMKCYVLLHLGQIEQFEESFSKYLDDLSKATGHRNCHSYLTSALAKELHSFYLSLPTSRRNPKLKQLSQDEYGDEIVSLDLQAEAMRIRMGVAKIVLGTGMGDNGVQSDNDKSSISSSASDGGQLSLRWRVLASVLDSLSEVADSFVLQGCVREAECYITEGMSLAQKFQLPRRYGRLLQQLIEVQIKWGQEDECKANLTKLNAVVTMDNQQSQPKPADAKTKKSVKGGRMKKKTKTPKAVTNTEESDEEDFIRSRPLSFSRSLAGRISMDMSSSPSLKPAPVFSSKSPAHVDHQKGCSCMQCMDLSLHDLETGFFLGLAGYYALTCNNEATKASLVTAKELLERSNECFHQVFRQKLPMLDIQSSFTWTCHHIALCKVVAIQAQVELEMGHYDKVLSSAHRGLALCELHSTPKAVDLVVQASFHYFMAIGGIHMNALNIGNSVFDPSWSVFRDKNIDSASDEVSDVAHQLSQLSMSSTMKQEPSIMDSNPSCQLFQSMLDTSTTRPEMMRKRDSRGLDQGRVLSEELGLFGDVVLEETDGVTASVESKPKASDKRAKSTIQVSTKKGAVKYKVAMKPSKSSKTVESADITTSSDIADGVFSFDEETVSTTKKPTRGRSKKGCSKQAIMKSRETVDIASDVIIPDNSVSSGKITKKARGRGRGAGKKDTSADKASDADYNTEILQLIDNVIVEFSDTEKDKPINAKSKCGRGRKAKDTSKDTVISVTKPKQRRGRVKKGDSCDIENTRGDPDPVNPATGPPEFLKLFDDSVNESITIDSLSHSLSSSEEESPSRLDLSLEEISTSEHQPEVSISDSAMQKKLKSNKRVHPRSSSKGSESSVECTVPLFDLNVSSGSLFETPAEHDLSIGNVMVDFQDDLDDIEIPRAGSDSEDNGKRCKRKGRGTKKNSGKAKTTVWEDVEAPRGNSKQLEERKTKAGSKKTSKTGIEVTDPSSTCITDLKSIQEQLEQCYNMIKHLAPCPLYRHICQLLALCHGDRQPEECSRYLAQASSVTLRHQKLSSLNKKLRKLRKASDKDDVSLVSGMGSLSLQSVKEEEERLRNDKKYFLPSDGEDHFMKDVGNALPAGYTICQVSVISGKPSCINSLNASSQLVITRIQKGHRPLVVRLPMNGGDGIVNNFERILAESKETVKETDKRVWWTTRQRLDEEMQSLTKDMENNLLSYWKGLIQGSYPDQKAEKKLKSLGQRLCDLLQEAGQRDVNPVLCECLIDSFRHLTHLQTNQALCSLTGLQSGTEDLTQLTILLKDLAKEWEKTRPMQRNLVILILDTAIQQLPWESMPILHEWPVCRLPNLHFLMSHLRASKSGANVLGKGINPDKTYFILNPMGDLDNTQKTFQDWFQKENKWKGVVGRGPSKPEYTSALTDHDLFVFCGHGTGRQFLTGDDIQRLTCKAATLLIGCSSGKLQVNGCLDASGMALNYLLAECPCVVANLWDVTDRDIDRFLEYLLKAWLSSTTHPAPISDSQSLAGLLNDARKTCKLKHLIGFAPVLYGLPAVMQES